MKGPGIFLAQFMSNEAPFNTLEGAAVLMASFGYKGLQLPSNDIRVMDLELAASSQDYCDELTGICAQHGLAITELSTHLQGQLVAVHPAYDHLFDGFAPQALRGKPAARTDWAIEQLKLAAKASRRLGLTAHATFSGALVWPYLYPWPQRPQGLVEEGFVELARRWLPILNEFDEQGVDVCYEIHPGEDLHDGATYERFLEAVSGHTRANILYDPSHFLLQQLDYLQFLTLYNDRIKMFHVKDAEFRPNGRSGLYGGYQDWADRPGRFRSPGDGQINFRAIFSHFAQHRFEGWAVIEWECAIKDSLQGAREGAAFVAQHMIAPASRAFDDFAASATDVETNRLLLGLASQHKETP